MDTWRARSISRQNSAHLYLLFLRWCEITFSFLPCDDVKSRRHGDYSAYGHLAERERVVNAAQAALAELACSTCKVFVMSNCGDEQECAAAYQALAKTRAWGWPSDGATTNHALMLT
eukprot:scaffold129851_cov32-Tisochrysis_lutea.AAC.2